MPGGRGVCDEPLRQQSRGLCKRKALAGSEMIIGKANVSTIAKCEGGRNHISSPPERRRELEGRIEPDDQPESDDAALEQHLARVRAAAAGAMQKGRKSGSRNALEESLVDGVVRVERSASLGRAAGCSCW